MPLTAEDIAITRDYQGVVDNLTDNTSTFFTDMFFKPVITSDRDVITYDVEIGNKRLAPLSDPCVVAPLVERNGFATYEFRPAYVMDRRKICCRTGQLRVKGEPLGANYSIQQRRDAVMRMDGIDQIEMLDRRIEVMAAEALITGKINVVGPQYPLRIVDFERNSLNTFALAGAARWNQAGVNPLKDLRTFALANQGRKGGYFRDVIMEPSVLDVFYENAFVVARLNSFRGTDVLSITGDARGLTDTAAFHGTIDGFRIWSYQDNYTSDAGVNTNIMPTGQIICGSPSALMGKRYFGRIMDEEVNYEARPYAVKSWLETHPSARYGLLMSAPLPVMQRPNAVMAGTVL